MKSLKLDTIGKAAGLVAIGSVIGTAVGLLFAPKKGKETRKDIANSTREFTTDLKETIKGEYANLTKKNNQNSPTKTSNKNSRKNQVPAV